MNVMKGILIKRIKTMDREDFDDICCEVCGSFFQDLKASDDVILCTDCLDKFLPELP